MWGDAPIHAVVFDCDGLLVDTERIWTACLRDVLIGRLGAGADAQAAAMIGGSVPETAALLEALGGRRVDADILGREIYDAVLTAIGGGVAPMPGAVELVAALRGSLPLGVASNGSLETVAAALAGAGIPPAFDSIVALDDELRPKPAPDLYLAACGELGVDPGRAIALEDSARGAQAARAAGMRVIGVGASTGLAGVADLVVTSLADARLHELLAD